MHLKRTRKKPRQLRNDWIFGADAMATKRLLANRKKNKKKRNLYNFEFFLNRAYAFNRDNGKCRICGIDIAPHEIETHHINPSITSELVNKVNNLASLHHKCHNHMHNLTLDEAALSNLGYEQKHIKKMLSFRKTFSGTKGD